VAACLNGQSQTCTPGNSAAEVCDGIDNDCDGQSDEGLSPISCGTGACARTVAACLNGQSQTCTPGNSAAEVCDGIDNDCDGQRDEGLSPISCGTGACVRTVAACVNGQSQTCTAGMPSTERCDGIDNDCDGQTDEDSLPATCGIGDCTRTVPTCVAGIPRSCSPGAPMAETCDGRDNDCNGAIDDEIAPATCGVGECARSVFGCVSGAPQQCRPGIPSADVCDGLDNDCNGTIDDRGICGLPSVMCPGSLSTVVGSTVTLTATATDPDGTIVSTAWGVTSRASGSTAEPTSPTSPSTAFTPDRPGSFVLQFCAQDNAGSSACCSTAISTSACSSPPSPPISTACGTSWDGRPIVQFAPVPDGLTYQLRVSGSPLVIASASRGQNHLRPASRVTAGSAPPGAAVALEVVACRDNDITCCSAASPLTVNVVEQCTTPVSPTSANVVLSEYIVNGEGQCPSQNCVTQDTCQAGESVEITNLSNCPVRLDGFHFAYRNANASSTSARWMNFGASDVIPPRGVYVAMRNRAVAPVCAASLGSESSGLYGLRISTLAMQGVNLCSGWFNNTGGGMSEMRIAPGMVSSGSMLDFSPGTSVARIAPYLPTTGSVEACTSVGFDAVDSCGTIVGGSVPSTPLRPNQLGRLWHPCDAVLNPVPQCIRN
jgi:hypothetical protein